MFKGTKTAIEFKLTWEKTGLLQLGIPKIANFEILERCEARPVPNFSLVKGFRPNPSAQFFAVLYR